MKRTTQKIERKDAVAIIAGAPVEIVAAEKDGLPEKWRGVLYTGQPFTGHWYWGTVYLDVAGFRPQRQDINALLEHDRTRVVGSTSKLTGAGGQIVAEGPFLMGTAEEEPDANMVRRRLAQRHPYQMSGRWQPVRVEEVEDGGKATVNGAQVQGPCAIFREFRLAEASFVTMGWDSMTAAVAASEGTTAVEVQIEGESMSKAIETAAPAPETPKTVPMLTMLAEAFGAQRAIELAAAKPDAKGIGDFAAELAADLKTTRAALATAQAGDQEKAQRIAALEAELKTAKAAPAVVTIAADPAAPATAAPKTGADAWKAEFAASAKLQGEFGSEAAFLLWKQREADRAAK